MRNRTSKHFFVLIFVCGVCQKLYIQSLLYRYSAAACCRRPTMNKQIYKPGKIIRPIKKRYVMTATIGSNTQICPMESNDKKSRAVARATCRRMYNGAVNEKNIEYMITNLKNE